MSEPEEEFVLEPPEAWGDLKNGVMGVPRGSHLHAAKEARFDEFYTLDEDVNWVIDRHADDLRGKRVFSNCDGPESAFTRLLAERSEELGLAAARAHVGPFLGAESRSILRESDLVMTNPPFSLLRRFILLLYEAEAEFLIVAPLNAVFLESVLPEVKAGRIHASGGRSVIKRFRVPPEYPKGEVGEDGVTYADVGAVWLTNLPPRPDQPRFVPTATYDPARHPRLDGGGPINCDALEDVPADYEGVMAVPTTYLMKHDPQTFEVISICKPFLNGRSLYPRVLIRRRDRPGSPRDPAERGIGENPLFCRV